MSLKKLLYPEQERGKWGLWSVHSCTILLPFFSHSSLGHPQRLQPIRINLFIMICQGHCSTVLSLCAEGQSPHRPQKHHFSALQPCPLPILAFLGLFHTLFSSSSLPCSRLSLPKGISLQGQH